jgi:hypothetical protein
MIPTSGRFHTRFRKLGDLANVCCDSAIFRRNFHAAGDSLRRVDCMLAAP